MAVISDGPKITMRHRLVLAGLVVAAWTAVSIAWTPPTYLVQSTAGRGASLLSVACFVFLSFVPWMVVTPAILFLARRFPLTERHFALALVLQICAGVVLLPLVTAGGVLLTSLLIPGRQHFSPGVVYSTVITTLYAVPTYVAVAGIGQALAYFDRYRLRERLLARAELRALEAQLNPHFLFNALNAISVLGYRDPTLVDRALNRLAELLRRALDPKPQEICLEEELGFVRGYLDLCAMIMPDQITMEWLIQPSACGAAIPTMLLQPLVENAVVHGVGKLPDGGRITVAAELVADRVRLIISNDRPEEPVTTGVGIGLSNVRERLRMLHGDAAWLNLEIFGPQACATVEFPYREGVR